jgi:hypothetical protein
MAKTDVLDALQLWAPTWPRRVSRRQLWTDNPEETATALTEAERGKDDSPFISVYSFPRGHSSDGNVPRIDTLFIDFDIEDGEYERGSGNRDAWQRDLSHLLVRVRQVAREIQDSDNANGWRAALSGHKGIHLFLDFEPLDTDLGDFEDYIGGVNDYAADLVDELSERTGISDLDRYVDVTSGDLSRLCRVPNTLHGGATSSFGEERYCVPVSLAELSSMTPEAYEEFTRSPRSPPSEARSPVSSVTEVVEQHVRLADGRATDYSSTGRASTLDWSRVTEYREQSNDNLTLSDVKLLTSDMPCVWAFHEREDKFQHGNQSHEFETHAIAKLLECNFPIDVIKEFLSNSPDYDEDYTEQRIKELIARDFNPYTTRKLLQRAPEFCGYSWCARCQRVLEQNPELQ